MNGLNYKIKYVRASSDKGEEYEEGGEIGLYKIKKKILSEDKSIQIGGIEYGNKEDSFKGKTAEDGTFLIWHKGKWIDGKSVLRHLEKIYVYEMDKGGKIKEGWFEGELAIINW